MRTRSIDANRGYPVLGLAAAVMLAATFAACNPAQAQERAAVDVQASATTLIAAVQRIDPTYVDLNQASWKGLRYVEDATLHSAADTLQSTDITVGPATGPMIVSANFPNPELWNSFRHSVSGAATSSCFGPDALSHEEFAVEGLLRLPFLMGAASAGACR
jgi:hypothetical protein